MTRTHISPASLLPAGTEVAVGNYVGVVMQAVWSADQFGAPICLHTIRLDRVWRRRIGNRYDLVPCKPRIEDHNYTGIYLR